jgi:predicted PurR-regulated permease PerM
MAAQVQELIEIPTVSPVLGGGGSEQVPEGDVAAGATWLMRVAPPAVSNRLLVLLLGAILAVLGIAALQFASSLLVPVVLALLLTLLLGPLVRWMSGYGVAEPVAAGIIVFGTITVIAAAMVVLSAPATDWLRRAPTTMRRVEDKLRTIEPVNAIEATAISVAHLTGGSVGSADSTAPQIQVATPGGGPLERFGWTTARVVGGVLTVLFLTYFLLASGSMFRRKIAYLFPSGSHRSRIKRALAEIEGQMSRYLLFNTVISAGFGLATWALLATIGVPNAVLWGTLAGVLNFIPYIGAFVTVVLIGIVTLASFDGTREMLFACGGFLLLDLLKGNLVAPMVLGRRMPLNTVAVLLSFLFWGWVWGVVGAILAVPLTVMIQVICSHSERCRGVAIVLGNWGAQRPT